MKKMFLWTIFFYTVALYAADRYLPHFKFHIPLGEITLPVSFWLIFLMYSFMFAILNRSSRARGPLHIIVTGIALNLISAFIYLEGYRRIVDFPFQSGIYRWYYFFIYYAGLMAICFIAAFLLKINLSFKTMRSEKSAYAEYVLVPFLAVFIAGLTHLSQVNYIIPALGIIFSAVLIPLPLKSVTTNLRTLLLRLANDERIVLVLFFIAALGIRVVYLLRTMSDPNYVSTGADGALFDSHAWKLATGQAVPQAYTAGYFVFLAGLYKILGHNYFMACFVQSVMGALVCIFIYHIIKIVTASRPAAYLGLFLASVNYSLIFSSISIGHQALDCFLLPFIALVIIWYLKEEGAGFKRTSLVIIFALASGYSVAARESNIVIVAAIPVFIFIHGINRKNIQRGIAEAVLFIMLFMLPIAPFIMRNIKNYGVAYPVKYSDTKYSKDLPAEKMFIDEGTGNLKLVALGINPVADPVGSIKIVFMQPAETISALYESAVEKFKTLFLDQTYGKFDMLFLMRPSSFYYIAWLYAFLITVFGIFYMLGYRGASGHMAIYLILTFIFLKVLPHLVFNSRFGLRPPIDVFLIIAFSIGVFRLARKP